MRRAYPLHPELLRRFSGDWSVLEKFQRTRGILKIMANAVYALWSGESAAPLITPALLPFREDKVRTALLEPLDRAFGPILQSEVDGDQSLPAQIEAARPRLSRSKAASLAARAVFFATSPHGGAARGGLSGAELRLTCAQPGDQIAVFAEALQELASRSAHLYRDGDSYWFSPQPTLNKLATDCARDVSDEEADRQIVALLRGEQRTRAGFPRVHAAPDNPTDIEDRRAATLVILPPSAPHDAAAASGSPAAALASEIVERRGAGQRRYRNMPVFVAADASALDTARENARRDGAWRSILGDPDLMENLTRAQTRDAETQAERNRHALGQSVRGAWVHMLYPDRPDDGGAGYIMRSARLVNRSGAKGIPQAVWDKAQSDGVVLDVLGPETIWCGNSRPSGRPISRICRSRRSATGSRLMSICRVFATKRCWTMPCRSWSKTWAGLTPSQGLLTSRHAPMPARSTARRCCPAALAPNCWSVAKPFPNRKLRSRTSFRAMKSATSRAGRTGPLHRAIRSRLRHLIPDDSSPRSPSIRSAPAWRSPASWKACSSN